MRVQPFGQWPVGQFRALGGGTPPPYEPTLFEQVVPMSQGRPFFTADFYAVDSVSGKVSAFIDWNDIGHKLEQLTSARQVAVPAPQAVFGGALCAAFTGAQCYKSTRAPSEWIFASDGVSFQYLNVFARSVIGAGNESTGCTVYAAGAGGMLMSLQTTAMWHYWTNAAGGTVVFQPYPGGAPSAGQPLALVARAQAAATPQWQLRRSNFAPTSGPYGIATDSVAPQQSFTLGCQEFATGSNAFVGLWCATPFFPALTPEQDGIVQQWIEQAYGFVSRATVLSISEGRPFFTADYYAMDGVSGKVASFIDWNDATHRLQQSTSALQVPQPAPHAHFAGQLVATFNSSAGAKYYLSNRPTSAWLMDHDGISTQKWDIFETSDMTGTGLVSTTRNAGPGTQTYYTTGGIVHYLQGSSAGVIGPMFFGTVTPGVPIYTSVRHELAASPQYSLRVRGTVGAADNYANAPFNGPADMPLSLGAVSGGGYGANMLWAGTFFTPALAADNDAKVVRWIQGSQGIAP